MKKISIYFALFAMLLSSMVGCDDNADFWNAHNLTQEEIDELARQDSIKKAQLESINADLILRYDAVFPILSGGYDGAYVEIETDKIAELFGITTTQLAEGINNMRAEWDQYEGAPEIIGFCIEGSTHADEMTAYNTNSCWGHWWDENGDVTSWGDDARVFAEYDPEGGYFHVGQMPGLLKDGDEIEFIECLKYNEKRVAVVITAKPYEKGEVVAEVVNTQEVSVEVTPNNGNYTQTAVDFDLARALADIGVSSLSDADWLAPKAEGGYQQELNADYGFWYGLDGYAGAWGDNASVWVSYGLFEDNQLGVATMPGTMAAGDQVTVDFGFLSNNKIEIIRVHVTVVPAEEIVGGIVNTINLEISMSQNDAYTAFPLTFDINQVYSDLGISSISEAKVVTVLEDGTVDDAYSANNGFWYAKDGNKGSWGDDASIFIEYGALEENQWAVGQMPGNMAVGDEVTVKIGFMANDKIVLFVVHAVIAEFVDPETPPSGNPVDIEETITLTKPYTDDYGYVYEDVKELLRNSFKMTTYQMFKAIQSGDMKVYLNEVGSDAPAYTGGTAGEYWIDADTNPVEWADGWLYTGIYFAEDYIEVGAGNHPENCSQEGHTFSYKLIATCNGVKATFNVTVNITAAE